MNKKTSLPCRIVCLFLCLFIITASISSCKSSKEPREIILALIEAEANNPDGQIYHLFANEWEAEYLSNEMLLSLYGFDRGMRGLSGGAVYLSKFKHPCEFAIFVCESTSSTEDISLYLHNRIKLLSDNAEESAKLCNMSAEEYRTYISSAAVIISGRIIALIISSDIKAAKRTFYKAT